MPYDDASREDRSCDDFQRLWDTNFLDNLWIDVSDYTFPNGVVGKLVIYNMEERQRVKIVDYVGSKKVETLEDRREAEGSERADPPRHVHRPRPGPQGRGHRPRHAARRRASSSPTSRHEIKEMPGGPKLVHLTFNMDEGPKVKIRKIDFVGNKAFSDGTLKQQMKENKERGFDSSIPLVHPAARHLPGDEVRRRRREGRRVLPRPRLHRSANVGEPELKMLDDSDGQEDALGRAADPGHRRAALQGRRASTSPATRSSRPSS